MRLSLAMRFALPAACAALYALAPTAQAADASAWAHENHAAMRLIAGSARPDQQVLPAGVELKLDAGWHTYWRYPGDSGLPPRFDFTGSQNLAAARVSYPAPTLFADPAGHSLGYKDHVIFPLAVTPTQPGKPVTLRVKVDYAICEKLCVPARGQAELTLAPGTSAHQAALAAAEARVPRPVARARLGLTIKRATMEDKPAAVVDIVASQEKPVRLFAEGPNGEWALPVPKEVSGAPAGKRRFSFLLDGLPPGVSPKAPAELTFTVVEGDKAFETRARLD